MVDATVRSDLAAFLENLEPSKWERLEGLLAEGRAGTLCGALNLTALGAEAARELMDAASDEMHHNRSIITHRQWLHSRIADAMNEIQRAELVLKGLDELGDVEYEGGHADLEAFLADASRALRAAQAVKPTDKNGD